MTHFAWSVRTELTRRRDFDTTNRRNCIVHRRAAGRPSRRPFPAFRPNAPVPRCCLCPGLVASYRPAFLNRGQFRSGRAVREDRSQSPFGSPTAALWPAKSNRPIVTPSTDPIASPPCAIHGAKLSSPRAEHNCLATIRHRRVSQNGFGGFTQIAFFCQQVRDVSRTLARRWVESPIQEPPFIPRSPKRCQIKKSRNGWVEHDSCGGWRAGQARFGRMQANQPAITFLPHPSIGS